MAGREGLALSGCHYLGGGGLADCREEVLHLGHSLSHLGLGLGFSPPQPSLRLQDLGVWKDRD